MKTNPDTFSTRLAAAKRNEDGSATFIFIVLLTIMMILVTAEIRALSHLRKEVNFLGQQQIKRLNFQATNTVATAVAETK